MKVETVLTCPLGSKCEEVRDGAIHRCAWYAQMRGTDPQTGEEKDERACAMAWMPILMVENSRQQRNTAAAVESFRNETVAANEASQRFLLLASRLAQVGQQQPGASLPAGPAKPAIEG